ncbi:MAG: PKD domain-containing protein [Planctomycetota bacterium]
MQSAFRRCDSSQLVAERLRTARSRRLGALGFAFLLAMSLVPTTAAHAQFADPQVVSGPFLGCFQPAVVYRTGDRVSISFTRSGEIFHTDSGNGFASLEPVSQSPGATSAASQMEQGSFILLDLVYEETDPVDGDVEIVLIDNNGGFFANPGFLTSNTVNDRKPQLDVGPFGLLAMAWERGGGGNPVEAILYVDGVEHTLGLGSDVSVRGLSNGDVLVAYLRGGQIFSRLWSGGAVGAETQVSTLTGVSAIDLELGPDGLLHAAVVAGGDLYTMVADASGVFGRESLVLAGNVANVADLAVGTDRTVIAFEESGGVHLAENDGTGWTTQTLSTATPAGEPAVVIDTYGYAHVAWTEQGQIRYTNDGPTPAADFVADVVSGGLPLTVEFDNLTQGVYSTVFWDFGDGTASSQVSPTHVYQDTGPFTVSLTVIGPSGTDTFTRTNYISGTLPDDVLEIADISAFAGQSVLHPILATNSTPIQGYQVAFQFDNTHIDFHDIDFTLSVTGALNPEFVFTELVPNGPASTMVIAVVLDFLEPFDGRVIAAGTSQLLLSLSYTVDFPLDLGTTIPWTIMDDIGDPPIANIYASNLGISLHPFPLHGETRVDGLAQVLFLRGDANYDQMINIGDAIYLLGHFFSGGPAPVCPDSGDTNDDGLLDIGDAIYALGFLFASGASPPYPFPGPGLDPTDDSLPPCVP